MCRLLREEARAESSTGSDSDDEGSSGHYWHFHPRPSPATHHPPDTDTLQASEIFSITSASLDTHARWGLVGMAWVKGVKSK